MNRAVSRMLACVVVSCVVGMSPARADDARLPVPPQAKVEDSLGLIRDAYEADYQAAKESGEPDQLIAQLCTAAGQEADPVRKYALLAEAENVAAAHDNYRKAVELLDARAELFQIDGLALKGDLLKRLAGPKVTADLDLCDQAMDTAREAMRSDRFGVASDAASLAVSIAKAIDREQKAAARKQRRTDGRNAVIPVPIGVELLKKATALQTQVTATEKSFEQYEAATEKAKTTPDDPAANAVIGSYRCFVRGDWKAGLPALAKSDLSAFASLAAAELKLTATSGPMDPQQAFALAGKWWSAAESKGVSDEREAAIKDHAAGFYAAIVDRLEGALEKKLATSRLRGLAPQEPVNGQPSGQTPVAAERNRGLETPIADFTYEFHQQKASIAGYRGQKSQVVIPSAINGMPVVALGRDCFKERSDVAGVSIPETVRTIDRWAFWGCSRLKNLSLPPALAHMGAQVFEGCSSLEEITIPATVTEIGWGCFINCRRLNGIHVDKGNEKYTSIDGVLYDKNATVLMACPGAKQGVLRIPSSVKKIEGHAFAGCSQLERILIPETVTEIPATAFAGCSVAREIVKPVTAAPTTVQQEGTNQAPGSQDLKYVAEPGGFVITQYTGMEPTVIIPQPIQGRPVIAIGKEAFKDNATLTRVVLPRGLIRIDGAAFQNCRQLTEVVIPEGVRTIHNDAFLETAIESLSLPATLEVLGNGNLPDQLESISVAASSKHFKSIDGILYDAKAERVLRCPQNRKTPVVLPASVFTIEPTAFEGCSGIESIALPASLVSIGFDAFHSCTRLRTIEIPPRVSNIHGGGWCFLHSSDLEAINVDPANATYTSVDGLLYDKNVTTLLGCPGGKKGTVVIPSTVKRINGWVFLECIKLERIVIPESVTEIDEKAFAGCNAERTRKK